MKTLIAIVFGLAMTSVCQAQQPLSTTVQLPTVSRFSINTVVSVPDGGTMNLGGGISSSASSVRRRGSRSSGRSVSAPGVSVSADLIIGAEVEAELHRRGRLALYHNARPDIHGTIAEQAKASFIARNLSRESR